MIYLYIRKLAGILVGIAVGCCVLIGLVTFYAARADAPTINDSEPTAEPEPTASAGKKHKKVTHPFLSHSTLTHLSIVDNF